MSYNYKSYKKSDVKNVLSGYSNECWIAPKSAFTLLQEPAPGATPAQGDTLIITTAHTFPAAEGFIRVYFAQDSVEAPAELVGPKGAKREKWTPKVFIPGDSPAMQEQVKALYNDDVIIILKDANCPVNQLVQFGCECAASTVSSGTFSAPVTGADGRKGWELTFESWCRYFYNATVTEKP